MSKFATKAKAVSTARRSRTINQEGHPAYQKTATEELYSALVSSFLNGDKFYESEQKTMERIAQLVSELNDQQKQKFLKKTNVFYWKKNTLNWNKKPCVCK